MRRDVHARRAGRGRSSRSPISRPPTCRARSTPARSTCSTRRSSARSCGRARRPRPRRAGSCARMGGTISIYGHDVIPEGYETVGDEQIVVSTSFGLFDQNKVYLCLDLPRSTAVSTTCGSARRSCRSTPTRPLPGWAGGPRPRDCKRGYGALAIGPSCPYIYALPMKDTAGHPHYRPARITCACGVIHETFSTRGDFGIDICSQLPPVLHGQAEADGHRRPHRPLQQEVRARRPRSRRGRARGCVASRPCHVRYPEFQRQDGDARASSRRSRRAARHRRGHQQARRVHEALARARRARSAGRGVEELREALGDLAQAKQMVEAETDAELRELARDEARAARGAARRRRAAHQDPAPAQGSERRQERDPRDPRRHRRRRGRAVRRRPLPDVHAVRRAPGLEDRDRCRCPRARPAA